MSTPHYVPLPPPQPKADSVVLTLSEKQEQQLKEVLDHFTKPEYLLPEVEKGELSEEEKFWLSHECLLRYLRATKWASSASAIKRLEETLKWRREYGLYDTINAEHVEPEQLTGKQILFGYDVQNRPAIYMLPSRQNTEESPRQLHHSFWFVERTIDLMPAGVETIALMINYGEKGKSPSMSTARQFLNILQSHYPERLGKAMIKNVPFLLNAFYKLITPFIDPITREKMKFNPSVVKDGLFAADMVTKDWGGDCEIIYEHEKYWPALLKLVDDRRKDQLERWRTLGGTIGIKEWDYKGGAPESSESEKSP